jgi:outer membrane protein TolC
MLSITLDIKESRYVSVNLQSYKKGLAIFLLTLFAAPIFAQEIIPPSPVILKTSAASMRIEDITVAASILQQEEFRPQGDKMTITVQDAIDIAMKQNPDIQINKHALLSSLANLDLTESNYRAKYNLDSRLDETLRRRASGSFRIDPEKGLITDTKKEYENDTMFSIGPRYTQSFKNGSRLDIQPDLDFQHYSEGAFDSGANNPRGNHFEDRYRLSVNYSYPINNRSRKEIQSQIENSKISAIQSDYNLFAQEKSAEETVINRYWNIQQLQERLDIQKERLLQSRRVAFIIETQYEFEKAAQKDVGQAQTDVLNNEASLIDLEGSLRNSMESLNIFLGIPLETELVLTDKLEVEPLPLASKKYINLVTSTNLDLKNLHLSIKRSENSLSVARLGQQPDLLLSTYANQNDESDRNLGAALIFSWAFGDGGATKARVRALEENLEQSKIRLWNSERQLVQSTYRNLRELMLQEQRIEIILRNVTQSQFNLDTGLIDFQGFGNITFRDLQDLQIDLALNRSNLVQAKVLYNIAKSAVLSRVHDYKPAEEIESLFTIFD